MFSKEKYRVGQFLTPEDAHALFPLFYPTTILAELTANSLSARIADGTRTAEIVRNHGKSILVKVTDDQNDYIPIWYRENEDIIIPADTFDTNTEPQFKIGQPKQIP